MLFVRLRLGEGCNLQRNETACVVGAHKQLYLVTLPCLEITPAFTVFDDGDRTSDDSWGEHSVFLSLMIIASFYILCSLCHETIKRVRMD